MEVRLTCRLVIGNETNAFGLDSGFFCLAFLLSDLYSRLDLYAAEGLSRSPLDLRSSLRELLPAASAMANFALWTSAEGPVASTDLCEGSIFVTTRKLCRIKKKLH